MQPDRAQQPFGSQEHWAEQLRSEYPIAFIEKKSRSIRNIYRALQLRLVNIFLHFTGDIVNSLTIEVAKLKVQPLICYLVAPEGQKGGGMGRVKDYIMQTGGDRLGRVRLEAIDTRGQGSALWSIPLTMLAVLRIWCAALLGKVALVHVNMGDRGSAVRKGMLILLVRLAGVPIVLHLHAAELMHHYQMAPPPLRWLMRLPFRTATCCIVIGNLWRDWLINDLGIRTEKIEVVYNGVPVPLVSRAHSSSAENAIFKFLFLGNLLERKGLSDLLHSLALLLKENASWIMTIAGGGDLERYKTLAKELGIFSYTNFVGWVDEDQARQMLREADALVLPSYDEGLPLVILEALGCGTPVVATAVGSIPEVLDDGRTVLFVRPGDRLGIAKKLLLLIKEPLLRQQLSDEGLALYRKRFQIDRFIDSLFDVYRRQCGITIEKADTKTVA